MTQQQTNEILFMRGVMTQQLKEFKTLCRRYFNLDKQIDNIFEEGKEPSPDMEEEFEKLKEEYKYFMSYFKKNDYNLWESEDEKWTPLTVANRIIEEAAR